METPRIPETAIQKPENRGIWAKIRNVIAGLRDRLLSVRDVTIEITSVSPDALPKPMAPMDMTYGSGEDPGQILRSRMERRGPMAPMNPTGSGGGSNRNNIELDPETAQRISKTIADLVDKEAAIAHRQAAERAAKGLPDDSAELLDVLDGIGEPGICYEHCHDFGPGWHRAKGD